MRKVILAAVLSVPLVANYAFADADAAKGYVKEAEELISNNDFDTAASKLELAETELDGVDAAAKAPVAASIEAAKKKITGAKAAADKPKYTRKLTNLMDEAEGSIGNLVTWTGVENQLNELFADDAAKAAIPDELSAAQKKFATFKKLNAKKVVVAKTEQMTNQVTQLESDWKEAKEAITSDSGKDRAIERMGDDLTSINKSFDELDATADPLKSLKARVDAVSAEFTKIALGEKVKEQVETIARKADLYTNEFDGWKDETTPATYAQMQKESSNALSYLNMPKTAALISRYGDLLKSLDEDADYKLVASAPEVKAAVDKIKADRKTAVDKAVKVANDVVDEAEKAGVKDESDLSRVKDAVRLTLGEDSPEAKTLMARMEKKIAAHEAATTGAEEAKVKLITDLRAKAETEYPKLYEGMKWEENIDLAKAGQQIGFVADNLSGYRFKPSDFYFTTTLGGTPVAGKIDPGIMKGIKATEAAIGRSLGDDDNDGKWDCIAIVTDKKVKLLAKRQAEANGTVDGDQVKATIDYAEPVEAVVIEIIAAKCGPFAGVKDKGVLKPDGTVGTP